MAELAGDDPFGFEDDSDDDEFCYDPFDCDGAGGGSEGEELVGGPFVLDVSDVEEFCVSGFAFPDGSDDDDDDILVVEDRESHPSHEEPNPETLGRSFDSDGGYSQFLGHLVFALDHVEDTSEEEAEEVSGEDLGGGGLMVSGFGLEPRSVIEEAADDDGADGLGLMLSGLNLDSRLVIGEFQTLVDADEAREEAASDDDMGDGGGLMLSGFDLRPPPPAAGAFRMLVEVTDPDDDEFLEMLTGHGGEARADSRRLPASREVVEGLPEVAPSEEEASSGCAVCKDGIAAGERVVRLPCKHFFHGECIRPWLAIRNTCPVCRYELPTGNAEYDRQRRMAGGASVAQQGASVQSGGATGTGDATECSAENGLEQNTS